MRTARRLRPQGFVGRLRRKGFVGRASFGHNGAEGDRMRRLLIIIALLAAAAGARAEECLPVRGPATYAADAETRGWEAVLLAPPAGPDIVAGAIAGPIVGPIAGQVCRQHYSLLPGGDPTGAPQILASYRDALRDDGAEILRAEPALVLARTRTGERSLWVQITSNDGALDVTVVEQTPHLQVLTLPGDLDYPLLGHMPDYTAAQPEWRDFDQRTFQTRDGEETIRGRRFELDYALRDGATAASDADIHANYRTALLAAGSDILFADERNTTARFDRAGRKVWVKVWSEETAINVTVVEQAEHQPSLLAPRGRDDPFLGRMPGYAVQSVERNPLDDVIFPITDGDDVRDVRVQGARTEISYAPRDGVMPASDLDIQLNYRGALAALGGQILLADQATTVARFAAEGALVWVKLWSEETTINLSIVRERTFKSTVRVVPADALRTRLHERGRVALFLPFTFDRPNLRDDTGPAIAEVVKLLTDSPTLRLTIENHTDNIGAHDRNLALSTARANRVRDALTAAGIDPSRLHPIGLGPDRPVTDNTTSETRARNRRTVLVRE